MTKPIREPWTPDIDVDGELAGRLIAQQFPELAAPSLEPKGKGWDNAAFLVNDAFVFRFPRRAVAAELIETEARILPLIASKLPLSIPTPTLIGKPAADYPWPFTGYVVLAGTVLSAVRAPERAYREVASALGTFLRVLHRLDLGPLTRAGLQGDKIGRLDRERMMPKLRERLEYLQSVGVVSEAGSIANFAVGIAPEKRHAEPTAVVHGDLYARHILVNDEYEPIGIIDWGDVHFGDPAVDLSIAYSLIPPRERPVFFDAYGRIDDRTMESARYRALYHSAMVAHYGHRIGDSDLVYVGITGLRNASS